MLDTKYPTHNTPNVKIIDPTTYPNWDELILHHNDSTIFHTAAWCKTICESYNYKPMYFTAFDSGRISTVIPIIEVSSPLTGKRGVSLPFTDYCMPIISDEVQFQNIYEQIINHGKKRRWKHLELRSRENFFNRTTPAAIQYVGHKFDLTQSSEKIMTRFRDSTKRNIKKAIKQGVVIKFHNSLESIKEYYRLHCITRKRQGIPPQPFLFFKKIYDYILSKNMGCVVLGLYQNKNVAGAVFLHFGENVSFKFGASDKSYQELRANNYIMWEAIKHYSDNGYKSFCFGRTDLENEGLRYFKSGWGQKENLINYYRYDLRKELFINNARHINKLYKFIFSRMPIPSLKMAGSLLYKHIG